MNDNDILSALKELKEKTKQRKFIQSIDLIINLKTIDLKKPENRFELIIPLPYSFAEKKSIVFIKDKTLESALPQADLIISSDKISSINKKEAKKLAKNYQIFIAQAEIMPLIGKHLGMVLAPKGKMPKPVPGNAKIIQEIIEKEKKSVLISNKKGKFMPILQTAIGKENLEEQKLIENIKTVYNAIENKLPQGKANIKSVFIKATMGVAILIGGKK